MTTYITILRGINVSGKNIIKMDALRELFSDLKFQQVQTYIQSGNVVYQTKEAPTSRASVNQELSKKIANAIQNTFSFEVPMITIEAKDLQTCIENNPFLKDKKKDVSFMHITFLADAPQEQLFKAIDASKYLPDEIQWVGQCVYLYCPNGYGNTKLHNAFLENKLKVVATTRNWKTCNELYKIANTIHA